MSVTLVQIGVPVHEGRSDLLRFLVSATCRKLSGGLLPQKMFVRDRSWGDSKCNVDRNYCPYCWFPANCSLLRQRSCFLHADLQQVDASYLKTNYLGLVQVNGHL